MLTLNVNKLQKGLNYRLPTIDQSIEAFYKDYKCGLPGEIKNINISSQGSDIIPYGRQSISDNDVRSVVNVLRSERLKDLLLRLLSNPCQSIATPGMV